MTPATGAARRQYLEECGSACLACREVGTILRTFDLVDFDAPSDARPTVAARCRCPACGAMWMETYTLAGVGVPMPRLPIAGAFEELREADGKGWDEIDDVAAYLGRD